MLNKCKCCTHINWQFEQIRKYQELLPNCTNEINQTWQSLTANRQSGLAETQ